jgi:hypothetical protein
LVHDPGALGIRQRCPSGFFATTQEQVLHRIPPLVMSGATPPARSSWYSFIDHPQIARFRLPNNLVERRGSKSTPK